MSNGDPVEPGGAGPRRRRRLTLVPTASSLPSLLAGSRFSCLREPVEEEDCDGDGDLPHVVVQVAEAATEDYPSWVTTPVVRRPKKSDAELLAEFWADAGFASPSSRFWEKNSTRAQLRKVFFDPPTELDGFPNSAAACVPSPTELIGCPNFAAACAPSPAAVLAIVRHGCGLTGVDGESSSAAAVGCGVGHAGRCSASGAGSGHAGSGQTYAGSCHAAAAGCRPGARGRHSAAIAVPRGGGSCDAGDASFRSDGHTAVQTPAAAFVPAWSASIYAVVSVSVSAARIGRGFFSPSAAAVPDATVHAISAAGSYTVRGDCGSVFREE
ncbi:hypothetical protein ACQ4PT_018196 [Festuca glaucescens]